MLNITKIYCDLSSESDHLRYSAENSFGPVVVYNYTRKCNLKCLHCYNSSSCDYRDEELTTAQAKELLAGLAALNCPVVLFSGGEPLLRDDLFELLAEAEKLALRTVISTNGTLVDSTVAGRLANAGVGYVGVSIDGSEEVHDKFRAVKGSFRAAIAGIENCQKKGLKTGLRFTITKANAEHIPVVFDIAASMGVRRICFYHLIRTGRAEQLDSQTLTPQQNRWVLDTIIEKTADYVSNSLIDEVLTVGNHCDGPYVLMKMEEEIRNSKLETENYKRAQQLLLANGGNKIGERIVAIACDGAVHPDQFWHNYSLGNVKDKTFREIWTNSDEPVLTRLRNKLQFTDNRCLNCRWFDFCGGNFRFLGPESSAEHWLDEPACYLRDDEIIK